VSILSILSSGFVFISIYLDNTDIHTVRKRQHQYPEFGHTEGEIQKKPAKKYISIQDRGGVKVLMVS
jgi:hypothetical protein